MIWVAGILIFLAVFIFILMISRITVHIAYFHDGDNDELKVKGVLWGILRYTYRIPVIEIDEETPTIAVEEKKSSTASGTEKEIKEKISLHDVIFDIRQLRRFLKHVFGFHTIVRHFFSRVQVKKLVWKSVVGTSDAALSGSLSGIVWTVKGQVTGLIGNYMRIKCLPDLQVQPVYNMAVSRTDFLCIISFRIGHAMLAAIKVIRHWRKGKPYFPKQSKDQRRDLNV
ncbi:DUF2953 domain-containing protein [Alteribacter natronophilus]|uniref:DUF2953 domain-containing protein n=1 Tax=Alteribacter natronophilus TaxID=2583810 RepID=UPI00110E8A3D|nr:DUF2953 domain-containing protein [Alteribacter natronophilus]TMW71730.1 DUF2953 domain-containing protein [Alteribacter natronophilus]